MVRAKLKGIENNSSYDLDPVTYIPDDFEDFSCRFTLRIGPAKEKGQDLFYLTICTPNYLARGVHRDGFIWGRHHLIVPEYNVKAITAVLTKFVEVCDGETWREVADKLCRLMSWEFEDYQQ